MVNHLTHVKIDNMDTHSSTTKSEIQNRASYRRHNKQRFWQILAPVGVGVMLALTLAVLVILTATRGDTGGRISGWADTSFIWLILPVMLIAIIGTLVIGGLIYLVGRVLNILPSYTYLGQQYSGLISAQVKYWSNKVVEPSIAVKSFMAGVGRFFNRLFGRSKG